MFYNYLCYKIPCTLIQRQKAIFGLNGDICIPVILLLLFCFCYSSSRGVAILFNNNFEFSVKKVYKDIAGNDIFAAVKIMGKEF